MNKYQKEKEKRRKQLINFGAGYREANAILRKFPPKTVDHMIKEINIIKVFKATVKNLNIPLDEVNTLLDALVNRGIKGIEAVNSLNSILINLTIGTGQSGEAMKKLNLTVFDNRGKFKGVRKVLLEIKEKTKNMTEEQKNMYLATISGKEQIASLTILLASVEKKEHEKFKNFCKGEINLGECKNCRFKSKSYLDYPCSTGIYQIRYSNKCLMWRKESLFQKILNLFF